MIEFELRIWRRRPDLNRGWRFCRFSRVGYVVDPSCLLLSADPCLLPGVWAFTDVNRSKFCWSVSKGCRFENPHPTRAHRHWVDVVIAVDLKRQGARG